MANTLKFGNGEWYGKKDTILAYNDENSNYKPLPFNFSRASKATVINKDGLIETVGSGQPRIDYKDDSEGALLLEPQRTNSFPNSEDYTVFSPASNGTGTNPVITSNYSVSPDGTQNADRIQFNRGSGTSSSDTSYVAYGLSLGTIDSTLSIYLKTNDGTTKNVTLRLGASLFDYDVTITSNWQRFTLSGNTSVDRVQILLYGNQNSQTADISCYGTQLEAGSYATSYIPTQGSAVTRLADSCSQTVPDGVIGQTEGTVLLDFEFIASDDVKVLFSLDGNAYNKRIEFWMNEDVLNGFIGGSVNIPIGNTTITKGRYKAAIAYDELGNQAFYVNGVQIGISTTPYTISNLDNLRFNVWSGGSSLKTSIKTKDIKLYNTRLSNSELAALTS